VVGAGSWLAAHTGESIVGIAVLWMASAPLPAWGQCNWSGGSATCWTLSSVGIGTATPMFNLHTRGVVAADQGANTYVIVGGDTDGAAYPTTYAGMWYNTTAAALRLEALSGGVARRNIVMNVRGGNVGIATANPQYLLSVKGTVGAEEFIVTNTGWSDYVFQPGYRLRPLSEVGAYIEANRHLPDIPSEAEVKEKGVNMGEMQSKLLAKVEELTLHMIQQEKENRDLRDRIARLEKGTAGAMAAK